MFVVTNRLTKKYIHHGHVFDGVTKKHTQCIRRLFKRPLNSNAYLPRESLIRDNSFTTSRCAYRYYRSHKSHVTSVNSNLQSFPLRKLSVARADCGTYLLITREIIENGVV